MNMSTKVQQIVGWTFRLQGRKPEVFCLNPVCSLKSRQLVQVYLGSTLDWILREEGADTQDVLSCDGCGSLIRVR